MISIVIQKLIWIQVNVIDIDLESLHCNVGTQISTRHEWGLEHSHT